MWSRSVTFAEFTRITTRGFGKMSKDYLNRLKPVITPTYHEKTNHIIVLPLFYATEGEDRWFPDILIKAASLVRHSLVLNTDVSQSGIPVKYFVEYDLYSGKKSLFEEYNISTDDIVFFDTPPAQGGIVCNRVSKKMYALDHADFKKYHRVVLWDSDLFACRKTQSAKRYNFGDFPELFSEYYFLLSWGEKQLTYSDHYHWWNKLSDTDDVGESYRRAMKRLNQFLPEGRHLRLNSFFRGVSGGIHCYTPSNLPAGFTDFISEVEPWSGDDELLCELWRRKTGYEFREYGPLKICWHAAEFFLLGENDFSFSHIYDDGVLDLDHWESEWQESIGMNKSNF